MLALLYLMGGFVLLIWGADRFVSNASALAEKLKVPSLIIGVTIVAFGTSAPELAVSTVASFYGSNEIALGNVIGSNIFNILFALGICAIITPLKVEKELVDRDCLASIIGTIGVLILIFINGQLSRLDGILMLLFFAGITYLQVSSAKNSEVIPSSEESASLQQSTFKISFALLVGLICIMVGGQLTVSGATKIAELVGLSEAVIGLTVVAIGTSLPELVTSVVATKKGENSIAIGNVIGSNIFNILAILGISVTINPITYNISALQDLALLIFISVLLFILAKKDKINRFWGVLFVLAYILYMAWLIVR